MDIVTVPARQILGAHAGKGGTDGRAVGRVEGATDGTEGCQISSAVGSEKSLVDLRGVVVVAVSGDIDLYTGPELRWALTDLLASPRTVHRGEDAVGSSSVRGAEGLPFPVRAVIVDLTEVEFIDSYAIGVLVQGHHLARRSGAAYALVATHPMIHTLFAVTGLAKVLPLHPDVAAAVADLNATAPSDRS